MPTAKNPRALERSDERAGPDVVECHAQHGACHDELSAPGAGGRLGEARREGGEDAQDGNADPQRFRQRQRLDTKQGADDHGLQRQRRQRKACTRGCRIADSDIVENEKQAEEAETEGHNARPITASRPLDAQHQPDRQHAPETNAPSQNSERDRIGIPDQIAGDGGSRAAETARDDCDQHT
jgi:hypothetical protein